MNGALKVILLLLLLGILFGNASANPQISDYSDFKTITINHAKVASSLTNFPVLVSLVNDSDIGAKAQSTGYDIFFTSSDGLPLAYERESFTISGGLCNAAIWVKVPYISSTSDTVIYMYYGNKTSKDAQNKSGVWDDGGSRNFVMVQHMNQNPAGTAPQFIDSTTYRNDGTALGNLVSGNLVSGKIDKAISFNGAGNYIKINDISSAVSLFSKSSSNPMLTGGYGSMWYNGPGDYHAYYGSGTGIYHATSSDGLHWTVDSAHNPVLSGTPGSWDSSAVEVPEVWKENNTWYMLYRGYNGGISQERHIGLATSNDGVTWTKSSSNPVLNVTAGTWEFSDEKGLDPWGIIKIGSTYYLWYNTVNVYSSSARATGLATSNDLIHWAKDPNNPIFTGGRYCTQPFKYGNYYYMLVPYYAGKIELYRDSNPTFYASEREFLGTILNSDSGTWDSQYLDTPSVLTNNIYRNTFPDSNTLWMYYTGTNDQSIEQEGLATSPFANLSAAGGASNSLDVSNGVTLETWLNVNSASQPYSTIFDKNNAYGLGLHKVSSKFYPVMELKTDLPWRFTGDGTQELTTGTWHHLAATYDSSSHSINYYLDGQPAGSDTSSGYGLISSSTDNLLINWPTAEYGIAGKSDEVRISNVARSPAWIQTEYNDQISPSTFLTISGSGSKTGLPVANFSSNVTNGTAPLTVQFTNLSTNATSWYWDFGDGFNSTQQNPVHTYISAGNYTVNLTASNANGTSSKTAFINVSGPILPVANFSTNVTSGIAPLTVQFTDQSTGSPTSWNWDFGDGTNSTLQSPSHTYVSAGNYTVNCSVSNANGASSYTATINVSTKSVLPVANFITDVASGAFPLAVQFTDLSTNATSWYWDFGDGATSIQQNPSHTYNVTGSYIVNLTVSNANGTSSKTATISGPIPPVANFSMNVTSGIAPLDVKFTDLSTNATSWYWDFGDGNNSTQQSPVHKYSSAGNYIVSLKASNMYGNSSATKNISVVNLTNLYPTFAYMQVITLSSNLGTGYQVPIQVTWQNSAGLPMNTSFADLRFDDGFNKLHYWIVPDSINAGSSCTVYVKLASSSSTLNMHWGNPTASSESDIANTMEFGDEFSGSSLNTSKWTGTATLSGGIANIVASNSISSKTTFGKGYETIARTRMNFVGRSAGAVGFYDGSNAALLNAYTSVPHFQLYTMKTGTSNGVDTPTLIDGNWHDVRVSYNTTSALVFDSSAVSTSTLVPSVALPTRVVSSIAGSVDADYLAVRKYNGADPIYTFDKVYTVTQSAPVAGFTATPTSGTVPLTVQFTDQSTGSPTSWNWDFGDGANSILQSPSHTYVSAGNYTVNLTVSNANGNSSKTTAINVSTKPVLPVANFNSNVTSGTIPLTVQFTDLSTNAVSWYWDFGDGVTSTQLSPSHTYNATGNYTVNLTVSNANGTSSKTAFINVSGPINPVANFISNVSSGNAPLNVKFNDSSLYATSWYWNFGDGANSTQQNPSHTYVSAGNYTVNLTVSNVNGTSSKTAVINVSASPTFPVANFSSNVTNGTAPLSVQFTDLSTNAASWYWDFGDGVTSTQQSPSHTYNATGNYTINLTVINANGTSSKTAIITVPEPGQGQKVLPVANFSTNTTSGIAPLDVQFTDLSTNEASWYWDFGDGVNSTQQNPVHTYVSAGNYTVNLTASNVNGTSSKTTTITVSEPGQGQMVLPVANFSMNVTSGTVPLTVQFTDLSTNAASWYWDFGDGATSTQQSPAHKYSLAGNYNVSLKTSNLYGNSSATKNISVINLTNLYPTFAYMQVITLSSNPGIGYQVPIQVTWQNSAGLPMNTSFADLRFDDGVNKLHYWIVPDSINAGSSCTVYVKLASSSSTLNMHWGNPTASSESDIANTMEFGDEFSGPSLNTSKWTGTATLSGGIANIVASNSISSKTTFGKGYETIARTRMNFVGRSAGAVGFYDGSNAALLNAYTSVPHFQLYTMTNGASNGVDTPTLIDGNWHDVRVSYNTTSALVFDSSAVSTSTLVPSVALPTRVVSSIAGSVDADYLAVRKYNGADPIYTFDKVYTVTQ